MLRFTSTTAKEIGMGNRRIQQNYIKSISTFQIFLVKTNQRKQKMDKKRKENKMNSKRNQASTFLVGFVLEGGPQSEFNLTLSIVKVSIDVFRY